MTETSPNALARPPWYGDPPSLTLGPQRYVLFLERRDNLASQTQGPLVPPHQGSEPPNFQPCGHADTRAGVRGILGRLDTMTSRWPSGSNTGCKAHKAEYTHCRALYEESLSLWCTLSLSSLPTTNLPSSI